MPKPFCLTVMTPPKELLKAEGVAWVQARLTDGGPISIYPGHAPLLAETVVAPLRYADTSGEHTIDLGAGILQVSEEDVTVFTDSVKPGEDLEPSPNSEGDKHFDRLTQELLAKLNAQPDGVLDSETE